MRMIRVKRNHVCKHYLNLSEILLLKLRTAAFPFILISHSCSLLLLSYINHCEQLKAAPLRKKLKTILRKVNKKMLRRNQRQRK